MKTYLETVIHIYQKPDRQELQKEAFVFPFLYDPLRTLEIHGQTYSLVKSYDAFVDIENVYDAGEWAGFAIQRNIYLAITK